MLRYWCFQKKKVEKPIVISDPKVQTNPLNLDELPETLHDLQIMEGALISHLVSLHYKLEETKGQLSRSFQKGDSLRGKEALAKRVVLTDKKRLFEKRLERVQVRIKEIQNS